MARERNIIEITSPKGKTFWSSKKETESFINKLNSIYEIEQAKFDETQSYALSLSITGIIIPKSKHIQDGNIEYKKFLAISSTENWFKNFFIKIGEFDTISIKGWKFRQG